MGIETGSIIFDSKPDSETIKLINKQKVILDLDKAAKEVMKKFKEATEKLKNK